MIAAVARHGHSAFLLLLSRMREQHLEEGRRGVTLDSNAVGRTLVVIILIAVNFVHVHSKNQNVIDLHHWTRPRANQIHPKSVDLYPSY